MRIGRDAGALAGIYQPVAEPRPETAVLICNPFGQEAIRAQRSLRVVAERLSRQGVPSLRFDYFGTGDSPGEDGSVQGLLDLMGIPYTHSGLATSVIAIDKVLTKQVLVPAGIPMPGGRIVRSADIHERDPLQRP